jgi:hypothetical protein
MSRKQRDHYEYPVVVVQWDDAVEYPDSDLKPRHIPVRLITVGWLLAYDDEGISIASEYSEDGSGWRNEVFIPVGMIDSVTELEL